MAYMFFIDGVLLPVAPTKMQTKIANKNKTMVLINEGEVNIPKSPGLTEITFEALLPQSQYPFTIYDGGYKSADYFTNKLKALKKAKRPLLFLVSRESATGSEMFSTEIMVTLEDYSITEDANNGFDLMVSITLKEWREYKLKAVKVKVAGKSAKVKTTKKTRVATKSVPKTYKVKKGETLLIIARKVMGDESKVKIIQALNKIPNPNKLTVGAVIKLA